MRKDMPLDDFLDTLLVDDSLTKASTSPASVEEKDTSPLETLFLNALNSYPELVEPVLPESKERSSTETECPETLIKETLVKEPSTVGESPQILTDEAITDESSQIFTDEAITGESPQILTDEAITDESSQIFTDEAITGESPQVLTDEATAGECDQILIKEPLLADERSQANDHANTFSYLHERAAASFQSIVCVINDTQIAFPLAELGGIHQISRIDRIAGKAEWCLGVMDIKGTSYNIVDGTRWLIDPKGTVSDAKDESAYQYVILLNDSDWGIACHDLVDTVLCEKENIKWRDPSRSKPWLAGIMKEQMCILLDTFAVVDMLQQGLVSNQQ